ncbi:hypothetical protein FFWV33_12010 [Flavobacterium faecale]|uniref:Carrier domain-containing protein n=1 Tax=Flavobacterium faecale TaxID=1355330 RepID=A0A2S1LEK9_9FLAO|nr:non-ribosomal peptide synthetase [Flavobacterium faecale]AWG22185.1 hypothetical protein FFWV33_12010 [Flavobacterium faecale]
MLPQNYDPSVGLETEFVVRMTKAQSALWVACTVGGSEANQAYNESSSLEFTGPLQVEHLSAAIQAVADRHESLRATFGSAGVYMTISKKLVLPLEQYDFTDFSIDQQQEKVSLLIQEDTNYLFDLSHGPLIRFNLIKLDENKHILLITAHHIVCDAWSFEIVRNDLATLYTSFCLDKEAHLAAAMSFNDYASEKLTYNASAEHKVSEKFWLDMYKEGTPEVNLPIDYPRPNFRTYASARIDIAIDSSLLKALKKISTASGTSFNTTLLASFEVFLHQITAQEELVIGLPFPGQIALGMSEVVGHCANLLPLRFKMDPETTFEDYLLKRKSELAAAYEHPRVTFGQLLEVLNPNRDLSRIPLVPIVFNVDSAKEETTSFHDLNCSSKSNPRSFEIFEIFVNATGTEENLVFEWSFNTALFKPESIYKMMETYSKLIKSITEYPSRKISDTIYSSYLKDYKQLNDTEVLMPTANVFEIVQIQMVKTPNNVAIYADGKELTYQELQAQVNQIAHYLLKKGLQPGEIVAVSLPRGAELVSTLLAILQCGAAYLPLDPEYPAARLDYMISDSQATLLLTAKTIFAVAPQVEHTFFIEDIFAQLETFPATPVAVPFSTDSLAYLLYTSGSTGKPKGVPITHHNLVNLLIGMKEKTGIGSSDKFLSITTISFDIAGVELYLPLISGASLQIANQETARDGRLLLDLMRKEKVTFLQATPISWYMLLDSGWTEKLPLKAICGGEAMPLDLARALTSRCETLWNGYGPTETTIYSIIKEIKFEDEIVTIGSPIANTQVYIIDKKGNLLPQGIVGEIAIAGDGVSKGYWHKPKLTEEKFITNTLSSSEEDLIYRTGDLGKLLATNEIEYLGRLDQQVKIRGHRIEPGEVEQALLLLPGIKQAVVLATANFLIAHIVPTDSISDAKAKIPFWREQMQQHLPPKLVPHDFNVIEVLPTTLNGKIDKKALSNYTINPASDTTTARNENELAIASIWEKQLQIAPIDIFTNFFELGGHSIVAVKVMIEIEKSFGIRFPLSLLFTHPTVEQFAKLLDSSEDNTVSCLVPLKASGTKPPLFLIHGAGLNVLNFASISKHFDPDQPVYGIQGTARPYDDWYHSIEDMAAQYIEAIVALYPSGPYALAGFSFGGVVAFEMTRQLEEQGRKVLLTALLDTTVDHAYYKNTIQEKEISRQISVRKKRINFFKEMIFSWTAMKDRTLAKKDYLFKKYVDENPTKTAKEAEAFAQFIAAVEKVNGIVDLYQLKPQSFSVDLFRSKDDKQYKTDPIYLGWKKAVPNGIIIHEVSGNHLDIVAPPNDMALAGLLQTILNERAVSI